MKPITAHQLAQQLLRLPNFPVYVFTPEGLYEPVASATLDSDGTIDIRLLDEDEREE